jgi:hypothetical protein
MVCAFEFGYHSIKRAGHICAGVAIGHWVHIHPVDAWSMGFHRVAKGHYRTADLICTEEFHCCHRVEASKEGMPFSYLTGNWRDICHFSPNLCPS